MAFVVASELAEPLRGLCRLHDTESYHDPLSRWISAAERLCHLSLAQSNSTAGSM